MLTAEDAVHLNVIVQEETDRAYRAMCARFHALVQDGIVEQSYKRAVEEALPENSALKARVGELERENERRKQDSEIVAHICGFISLYDCVVAGQRVDDAVLTVLDEQRAEIVRLREEVARLRTPTHHGPYHEDAGVRGVDDV